MTEIEWDNYYGISKARAIELGEDPEYPRIAAAVFHFDKLTPAEQRVVIDHNKKELVEARAEKNSIYKQAVESGRISRELHVRPGEMNPYPHRKKENTERIAYLERQIADMENKAVKPQPNRIVPDATHSKSVAQIASNDEIEPAGWKNNKRPNLGNVVELHPSNGSWRNFLKDAELLETKNGIKHYISSNGHYIVLPDGEVVTFYGYKGQAAFEEIAKDKDGWLKRRAVAEHEMDELLHPSSAKSNKSEPISISASEASEAGRELSTYGQQKRKYKVTNHKGKSSRKSQHTSTGLGSAR